MVLPGCQRLPGSRETDRTRPALPTMIELTLHPGSMANSSQIGQKAVLPGWRVAACCA